MPDATDYFSIMNLLHQYSECVDEGNFNGVGQMFEHANVYMPGDVEPSVKAGTRDFTSLMNAWTRLYPETGTPRTKHLTTNHIIEFDGPTQARSRSTFTVLQQTPEFHLQPIIAGSYHDRFEKAEDGWRFVERREYVTLVGDLSAHLLQSFAVTNR